MNGNAPVPAKTREPIPAYDPLGINKYRRMSSLIGNAANLYSSKIVDALGNHVKNYEEVSWENEFFNDLLTDDAP